MSLFLPRFLSSFSFFLSFFFSPLGVFLLPLFFPISVLRFLVPFFLPWLPPFYSELIQWDFSLLPLGLHQLFLVCCGHPFKITHSPIGCPDHCHLLRTCLLHDKIPFCLFLPYTSTSLPSSMACISGPNHLLLLLGKIPSQQGIYPKRSYGRKPNIDPLFPPPPNHAL